MHSLEWQIGGRYANGGDIGTLGLVAHADVAVFTKLLEAEYAGVFLARVVVLAVFLPCRKACRRSNAAQVSCGGSG